MTDDEWCEKETERKFWNDWRRKSGPDRQEIKKAMSEGIDASWIKERRKEYLEGEKARLIVEIDETLEVARKACEQWMKELIIEMGKVAEKTKKLKSLAWEIDGLDKKRPKNWITQEDIDRAKEMDIAALGLIQGTLWKAGGGRWKTKCLWHDEKSPSLMIFPDGHAYCFGACHKRFTAIDVMMKVQGLPFIEAVRLLVGK